MLLSYRHALHEFKLYEEFPLYNTDNIKQHVWSSF